MKAKPRIVSGIQPTGKLHVGNYLGAIKNFVELQNSEKFDCFFFIADLHSLSETYTPEAKKKESYDLLASLLALGLDPKQSTIFLQSHIVGHTELAWLFSTVVPVAELERMTQYKDKAMRQKANINAALLTYPILQAADILMYKGEHVPVGKDQEQHIELSRFVAKKMNAKFGTTFPGPKPLFTNAPKVMSLKDPTKKMSKSLGDAHVINMFDGLEVNRKKVMRATSSDVAEKGVAAFDNLYLLLRSFSNYGAKNVRGTGEKRYAMYSELKKDVATAIEHYFAPLRKKYSTMIEDLTYLDTVLDIGRRKAQPIATQTLDETKEKMGLL